MKVKQKEKELFLNLFVNAFNLITISFTSGLGIYFLYSLYWGNTFSVVMATISSALVSSLLTIDRVNYYVLKEKLKGKKW